MLACNSFVGNTAVTCYSTLNSSSQRRAFHLKVRENQFDHHIFTSLNSLDRKKSPINAQIVSTGVKMSAKMFAKIEPPGMEEDSCLLEDFAKIPSIARVSMVPINDQVKVSMEISKKDIPQNSNRRNLVHFILNEQTIERQEAYTFVSMEMSEILFMSPSPSGNKIFVAKKPDTKKETVIQIWNGLSVEYELIIPEKLHGPIVNDGWFGCRASWSPDEALVAYVAERPKHQETPEWGNNMKKKDEKDDRSAKYKTWKGVGEFEEDWGEANTGKQAPAVYVLDTNQKSVIPATNLDPSQSYGQPVWSHNHLLVYVQWNHESTVFPNIKQRLGMVYCFNRPCTVMGCHWPNHTEARALTCKHLSAFSPRFSKKGDMIFLSQENAVKSGVHSATPSLHVLGADDITLLMNGSDAESRCLQGTNLYSEDRDTFPGLYASMLPEYAIVNIKGNDVIFITVQWRSCLAVVAVDIVSGQLKRVSPNDESSWSLLGVTENGWVMLQESNPHCPCKVFVGQAGFGVVNLTQVRIPDLDGYPETVHSALRSIKHEVLEIEAHDYKTNAIKTFEATLIHNGHPRPTLVMPHGGPHSAYSTQFVPSISFLAASGFNILTVNYRGSIGFGEDSLQSLPGRIGDQDVKDCFQALQQAVQMGFVMEDKVAVVGGSHGGFLSGHLIGQYPEAFKSAVLRNPVCNISLMIHLTDIPDWCFIETFGSSEGLKRAQNRVTLEDLYEMEKKSPIVFVEHVKAPILMMLGGADRRVPMDDGKRYIARLKQSDHAPDSRIIVFDTDEHGLTKPQTDFEQWLTALWWLKRML